MPPVKRTEGKILTTARLGVGRAASLSVELVTTAILMRMLAPEAFGLVAMAMSVIVAFAVLAESGIGMSLVSDRGFSKERTAAALILSLVLGVALAAAALALTPAIVYFYQDPRVAAPWIAACALVVLSSVASVPISLAQRAERFALIAGVPFLISLASGAVAIGLAYVYATFWPLVIRHAVARGLTFAAYWWALRPQLGRPTKADFVEVLRFSRGVVGFSLLNCLSRNIDKILIGRFLGVHELGLYAFAYNVLSVPVGEFGRLAQTIAYPKLSRYAPNWQRVGAALGAGVGDITAFVTPLCLGLAVTASDLIPVIFGSAWADAVIPFRVLAVLAIYQIPFACLGLAYTVTRRTGAMMTWALWVTPPTILSFVIGLQWGIAGVTVAYAITCVLFAVPLIRYAARILEIRPAVLAAPALGGLCRGALAAVPLVVFYGGACFFGASPLVRIAAAVFGGAVGEAALLARSIRREPSGDATLAWERT